ncbi:uncharacterized protein BO97DRAFT_54231 [Aspergillus homomorphus CBS 101889]|uniref:Uncharacterized protein n=1 Tax=Aspergillus homomorphus (strain CBS 101889) TaxID=1450537 RepID=A0A395HZ57_ASPHC|nr:hypothetical protein BO97DRAFT_54231 [Aspergillus homomorphus CBS 101889]RAL12755.1 hypothetical protein BO97DRAFT_54231 [Aspergillus homomorphus CBS 101889]
MAQLAVGTLLRCQNTRTLGQSIGSCTQKRTYSNKVPQFQKTDSNKKLFSGLQRFRNEVFIPLNLSQQQKLLIYRKKHQATLKENPVTVTVGEKDEYRLRPMDYTAQPRNTEANRLIHMMETSADWQNLRPFLTALHHVNRKLNLEMVVRRAGMHDALGAVLETAKAKDSGFSLKSPSLVQKIFFELHLRAQQAEFKGRDVDRMLRLGEQFINLMALPRHENPSPASDAKRRPAVVGVMLELSAARALHKFAGKDEDHLVHDYSHRLLACMRHLKLDMKASNLSLPKGIAQAVPLDKLEKIRERKYLTVDRQLEQNVPIYHALQLARKVAIDPELSKALEEQANRLDKWIQIQKDAAPEKIKASPTRGYQQSLKYHGIEDQLS